MDIEKEGEEGSMSHSLGSSNLLTLLWLGCVCGCRNGLHDFLYNRWKESNGVLQRFVEPKVTIHRIHLSSHAALWMYVLSSIHPSATRLASHASLVHVCLYLGDGLGHAQLGDPRHLVAQGLPAREAVQRKAHLRQEIRAIREGSHLRGTRYRHTDIPRPISLPTALHK